MKKQFSKIAALLMSLLLLLSATGCFSTAAIIYRAEHRKETEQTKDYSFFGNDEDDDSDSIPVGCAACGGDYPNCKSSCPMFDD